jgi:putative addiction module component (TIGR02574 family)
MSLTELENTMVRISTNMPATGFQKTIAPGPGNSPKIFRLIVRRFCPGPGFALVKIRLVSETCRMPMTLDQIVEETREMPSEVVAELIDRILVARHGGMEPSVAESWKTETDRRIAEIEAGKVKGVTPEENAARIQKILRR